MLREDKTTDLRPQFKRLKLRPRSQGKRPTCSVFVVIEAFEYAISKMGNATFRLSVEHANWASSQEAGKVFDGSYFHHAIDGVMKRGLCLESSLRYRRTFDPDLSPSKDLRTTAKDNIRLVKKTLRPEVVWIAPLGRAGLSQAKIREAIDVLREGWPVGIGAAHSLLLVGFEGDPRKLQSGVFHVLDSATRSFRTVDYSHLNKKVADAFYVRCRKPGNVDLR